MISRLLHRLLFDTCHPTRFGRSTQTGGVSSREPLEACPPAPGRLAGYRPVRMRDWLTARWRDSTGFSSTATPHRMQRRPEQPAAPLAAVRADFSSALVGEDGPAAAALLGRIGVARSPRELWHLRAEVYSVVARLHGEAEARDRLRRLDRHFATRSSSAAAGRPAREPPDPFTAS